MSLPEVERAKGGFEEWKQGKWRLTDLPAFLHLQLRAIEALNETIARLEETLDEHRGSSDSHARLV